MKKIALLYILLLFGNLVHAQNPLDKYLRLAAENNPGIQAKFKAYLSALEKVDQQGALPDPTIGFGYFLSPVETRVGAQRFKASLNQMFPWKGTLSTQKQLASAQAKIKFEEFESAKNQLFLQVKSSFLMLYELEREVKIYEANLKLLKSYEPVTKTKYESNLVSLADLVRVQIKIDEATTKLELLNLKRKPLLNDFNTLLNQEVDFSVEELNFNLPLNLAPTDFQYTDSALINNPGIRMVEQQIKAVEHQSALAELARRPRFGVGLEYGFIQKRDMPNLEDNGKDILTPTFSLSLPVFGKKNKALKREAILMKESYDYQMESVKDQLANQWVMTEYQLKQATTELDLYAKEIEKTELLLRVLTSEYSNNNSQFEELLATQQSLLQLQLAQIKSHLNYQEAIFKMDFLLGSTLNQFK